MGVHWVDVAIVAGLWLASAVLVFAGWWVLTAPRRRFERHVAEALAVAACMEAHPSSGRWGAGPVPVEDSDAWGAR